MASSEDGGGWVSVDSYHDYRPDLVAQLYNELLAPSFLDPAGTACMRLPYTALHVDAPLCGSAALWTRVGRPPRGRARSL